MANLEPLVCFPLGYIHAGTRTPKANGNNVTLGHHLSHLDPIPLRPISRWDRPQPPPTFLMLPCAASCRLGPPPIASDCPAQPRATSCYYALPMKHGKCYLLFFSLSATLLCLSNKYNPLTLLPLQSPPDKPPQPRMLAPTSKTPMEGASPSPRHNIGFMMPVLTTFCPNGPMQHERPTSHWMFLRGSTMSPQQRNFDSFCFRSWRHVHPRRTLLWGQPQTPLPRQSSTASTHQQFKIYLP